MPSPISPLVRRNEALEKTLAKYRKRPFEWGISDCVSMLRSHLVAMGHRGLPKLPRYRSAAGAKRALSGLGYSSVEEMLEAHLPRITPAAMLPGDVAVIEGTDLFDAVVISLGVKVFGWHEDSETPENIIPHGLKAAYRV